MLLTLGESIEKSSLGSCITRFKPADIYYLLERLDLLYKCIVIILLWDNKESTTGTGLQKLQFQEKISTVYLTKGTKLFHMCRSFLK